MKRIIIAASMAAILAAALSGCIDNTSNGGLEDAPYNNSGIIGNSGDNITDDSLGSGNGFVDAQSDNF